MRNTTAHYNSLPSLPPPSVLQIFHPLCLQLNYMQNQQPITSNHAEKDFDSWNRQKKGIDVQKVHKQLFFSTREVWWSAYGLNIGSEENGKNKNFERPVIIIRKFNAEMIWVLPLTTKQKSGKFYHKLERPLDDSSVIISQIKTISTKRLIRKIGTITEKDYFEILQKVHNILTNESPLTGAISEAEATSNLIIPNNSK